MNEECETVPSQKGGIKIKVDGYLMTKEKNCKNTYYWCCDQKKFNGCTGRAVTQLRNNKHYLKSFSKHKHAPQAHKPEVAKVVHQIKQQAKVSRDKPVKIIQDNIISTPEEVRPYLPSVNSLCKTINRVRQSKLPPQPRNIMELNLPESLRLTLNGNPFLIKDQLVGQNRILIYTTVENIRYLSRASFWIMDGTFDTVPTIFRQLYTIHAPVGAADNFRILPRVYSLMTHKSEEQYIWLFESLIDFADENGIELNPPRIITDFEIAAINASQYIFPEVINKSCQYGNDLHFSNKIRCLFALAFLPPHEIPSAFNILKPHLPQEAHKLVLWFEETYVLGEIRRETRGGHEIRGSPLFPPKLWSVHDSVDLGIPRTQNAVEGWHNRWATLVGGSRVSVFSIVQKMQREQLLVESQIECTFYGESRPKQKWSLVERERRIMTIVNDRNNRLLIDFLEAIAHNLFI
ncbi:3400_t:CDS:2 [Dentiscutata heterogama]|uniref:3400_t:CDS:1 n=1 Tax=Dentiscutata heterogama TaxID=1316150 RepID=A0ACA9LDG1_9GLOM|nr:3400_t:CDS:2 [Dentiscutata heterogama]